MMSVPLNGIIQSGLINLLNIMKVFKMISIGYVNFAKRSVDLKRNCIILSETAQICMILNQMFHDEQTKEKQYLKDTGTYAYFDPRTEVAIFNVAKFIIIIIWCIIQY